MDIVKQYLESLHDKMKQEYESCKLKLKQNPDGYLDVQYSKKGIRMYWVHKKNVKGKIKRVPDRLSEADFPIAKGIRDRFILQLRKKALATNLKYIDLLLKNYTPYHDAAIINQLKEPYKTLPGFEHLLVPEHSPIQSENPGWRGDLIHKNHIGELFRSKAEMHISELLLSMNIPYRYEMKLVVNGETKYPDFVIKRPGSDKKKYIEYFGMLEEKSYEERNFNKINWYLTNGFIPGRNILFLFENTESGMDLIAVQNQIEMLLNA